MSSDLRDRIAAALLARVKQSVTIDPGTFSGMVVQPFSATMHDLADAVLAVLPDTCDASTTEDLGLVSGPAVFGPCILRHQHDGPVHKDADGKTWCPTPSGIITLPEPLTEEQFEALRSKWNEQYGRPGGASEEPTP